MAVRGVEIFAPEGRRFEQIGGNSGDVRLGWDVSRKSSSTIACGVATFENCELEWTVTYEEYIYCLEGTLTLQTKEKEFILKPGWGIWLPEGTWLVYKATQRATVAYTIYPANWRERYGRRD
jgi:ethanolamine utilization protein EutQ (cupin superfamily)